MQHHQFLQKLAREAELQAQISARKIVPKRFETLASFIVIHAWKFLVVISGLMALLKEVQPL